MTSRHIAVGPAAGCLLVTVLTVAGCARAPSGTNETAGGADFDCGGTRVHARFAEETLTLTTPGGRYRLARVVSGSGAKYEGPEASFWEHQGNALVTVGSRTLPECVPLSGARP